MIGKDMVDHRLTYIYASVLKNNMVFKQYFYQKIKMRLTGNVDIVSPLKSKKANGFGKVIEQDSILTLTPHHQPVGALIHFTAPVHTRIRLLKLNTKWCIIYVKEMIKNLFRKCSEP